MKFKTTAIAMAVAGIVAAPMAAQADIGAYASGRIGLEMNMQDKDPVSLEVNDSTKIKNHGSRFGIKGENDMGNGMTSFAHYEMGINDTGAAVHTRNLHVGLRGDFGEIKLGGVTYATFYNHVTGPVDQGWWEVGFGILEGGRTKNVINYEGGSNGFSWGVAIEANGSVDTPTAVGSVEEETSIGFQVAGDVDIGPVKIGLGLVSRESADKKFEYELFDGVFVPGGGDVIGATISGDAGSIYYALSYQADDDQTGIELYVGFGNFYFNYGQIEYDYVSIGAPETFTPSAITLGYTQSIGRGTTIWYEYLTYDADVTGGKEFDYDKLHAVLKVDWK